MTFLNKYFKSHPRRRRKCKRGLRVGHRTVWDLSPGQLAQVTGFSPRLTPERRALLRAYGLVPGYSIQIVQHSPVSVIQVEQTEIALEKELAEEIFVNDETLV